MKPVCNNFASCGQDERSIFLGQDGTLSLPMTQPCPPDFPFMGTGSRAGICSQLTDAVGGDGICADPEHPSDNAGFCSRIPLQSDATPPSSPAGGPVGGCGGELCADGRNLPISPGFADFRELRSVLEQSPGGMCYYTGLDEPGGGASLPGLCGNGTCYSNYRREGAAQAPLPDGTPCVIHHGMMTCSADGL
jgi:hypothetical protein